jgi:pimeloyl-ACP methyl ester carboxylesterase
MLDSSEGWTELCGRLTNPCIAPDLPGFGYSDAPDHGEIEAYARNLAEALAILGIERFTLVGHSLGGAIATALAELLPDKVGALVLLAPAGFGRIHIAEMLSISPLRRLAQAALPLMLSSRLVITLVYVTMVTNGARPEPAAVTRLVVRRGELAAGAQAAIRAIVAAGRSPRAFHRRRVEYDGPVFAIWGRHDRVVPTAHLEGVQTALPQARVDIWSGMGHHPQGERHAELADVIAHASRAATQWWRRRSGELDVAGATTQPSHSYDRLSATA